MNRLTNINKPVPTPIEEHRIFYGRCVARLFDYENTGLLPHEIEQLKADNARLHILLDDIESVLKG